VGFTVALRFGERSQPVMGETSLSRMAWHRAPIDQPRPKSGWVPSWTGASERTPLVVRRQWRGSLPAVGTACSPHQRWVEVMRSGPWPLPAPVMTGGGSLSFAQSLDGGVVHHQNPFLPELGLGP
jgi:hypothetical protein